MIKTFKKIDIFFASLGARFWTWFAILGFLFVYGLLNHAYLMAWPAGQITLSSVDSDVWLRLAKIRDYLVHGNFYDHSVPATNAPYGGVETPWTRPVDFIVLFLYKFMPVDLSIEKRLMLTAVWYSLLMSSLIIVFTTKAAETGFKSLHKFAVALMGLGIYFYVSNQTSYFSIGNVDHHSLQTLLWIISVWLLLSPQTPSRAAAMGASLGVWIWISPEALPLLFTIYCLLGLGAIFKPYLARYALITSLSVTATTLLGLLCEVPWDKVFISPVYDTLSIIHVIFFAFCAAGFWALYLIVNRLSDLFPRMVWAGATAMVLSGVFTALFPKFIKGPMADADPYITEYFLTRVSEAIPMLDQPFQIIFSLLFLPAFALILAIPFYRRHPQLLILVAVSLIMSLFQLKWYYYLETISIIAIAKILPSYALWVRPYANKTRPLYNPVFVMAVFCILSFTAYHLIPVEKTYDTDNDSRCQIAGFYLISSGQLQKELGDKALVYESNILGNSGIAFFTPYHYVAGYYHREGSFGMRDQNAIFEAAKLEDIRSLLHKRQVNALMICPMSGAPSWTNDYFSDSAAPDRKWVQIHDDFIYPAGMRAPVKPVLLTIQP